MTPESKSQGHFTWNIVTRGLHGHPLLREKIYSKIRVLERHLQHFPPDAVHLVIELERHPHKEEHRVGLTLRLPSHILHAEKSARTVITALTSAVKALVKEVKELKERLRAEPEWKRKARRKLTTFASMPAEGGELPRGESELRDAFFEGHRARLERYARRMASRAPRGAAPITDAEIAALVGEAKDKLAALAGRRQAASDRARLYRLVREAVTQRSRQGAGGSGHETPSPMNEPDVPSGSQLLPVMNRLLSKLPEFEQEVFDLHYVDGFDPDEIAMIIGKTPAQVNDAIRVIEDRIRQDLRSDAA